MIIFAYWKEIMMASLFIIFIAIPMIGMICFMISFGITNGIESARTAHFQKRLAISIGSKTVMNNRKKEEEKNGASR